MRTAAAVGPSVAFHHVGVQFGRQQVLADIDLAIDPGQFVGVVGESGCGKTTLLRLVAGLLPPSQGAVHVGGAVVTQPAPRVSLVFQSPTLLRWRTALENVLLPAHLATGRVPGDVRVRAVALLEQVGLAEAMEKLPHELSGGMQSRVALARALLLEPTLLLLDEPFAALDALTRERLGLALLELLRGSGITALFVTHDIAEAALLSDRVVLMSPRPGRVVRSYPVPLPRPRTLAMRYTEPFVALCREIRVAMEQAAQGDAEVMAG